MLTRRTFVIRLTGLVATGLTGRRLLAQLSGVATTPAAITVYKSSSCGCCVKWIDHLKTNGFRPTVYDEDDMDGIKDKLGVPTGVRSCHTAVVDHYLVEGHVPAAEIRRLLAEQPKVVGLAVPGMPSGTPGMAGPGAKIEDFDVIAFQLDGTTRIFARY